MTQATRSSDESKGALRGKEVVEKQFRVSCFEFRKAKALSPRINADRADMYLAMHDTTSVVHGAGFLGASFFEPDEFGSPPTKVGFHPFAS